jgi:hypothetical protein
MFADAKHSETDFIRQSDRLEQFAEMPRRFDCVPGYGINRGSYKTIESNFHV